MLQQQAPPPPINGASGSAVDHALDKRLEDLRREIHAQGNEIHVAQRNFSIFAVLALVISFAMLLAVALKLGDTTNTTPAVSAAPAVRAATPVGLPSIVSESLTEMKFVASASTVAAGKVTFNVRNDGAVSHELVVLKTPIAASKLPTSSAGRPDESANIGETGDVAAGAVKKLTLNLKAGHYALICNLPGHYTAGMFADLTVK